MQDLLDPAVMKDFILQINDATSVDLLIDESLNNLMQQAMQLLDEVLNVVDETVISTEVPVEELLPEESSSAQTEPQETVLDAEKPQTVEAKQRRLHRRHRRRMLPGRMVKVLKPRLLTQKYR